MSTIVFDENLGIYLNELIPDVNVQTQENSATSNIQNHMLAENEDLPTTTTNIDLPLGMQ